MDLLKAEKLNCHQIQDNFIFGDDDANTSKETVVTINDLVLKTTVSDLDTAVATTTQKKSSPVPTKTWLFWQQLPKKDRN